MKPTALILMLAACTLVASAQTPVPPAAPAAKPATTAVKPATAPAKPAVAATAAKSPTAKLAVPAVKAAPATPPTVAAFIKDPAAIAIKGIEKPLFTVALRYKEIKAGTGVPAEPGKLLKCNFTLWVAATGAKIDSNSDHRAPLLDKDHKPVMDADGKPKLGDPQPVSLIMGQDRPLPGWDMGFEGMKAGGQRRVYIPWQLGLGAREVPARDATHPAIPAKSDLILDLELVDVADAPLPPQRPGMMPGGRPMPGGQPMPPRPGAPGAPGASGAPGAPGAPMRMMVAPKPAAPSTPGTAPNAPAPPTPAPPATTPAPAAPPAK
ncbi:MAG: FKBP-type peptidyl-prolyl cis-trans isomerase [Terracidiphilus sp.]